MNECIYYMFSYTIIVNNNVDWMEVVRKKTGNQLMHQQNQLKDRYYYFWIIFPFH